MIWIHVLLCRRALAHQPLRWISVLLLSLLISTCALGYWWATSSVRHDLMRQAGELAIDIIVAPEADSVSVLECIDNLHRRPDVGSVTLLSSRHVWNLFQQELGVEAGGLTDVAAMPRVIQVQLRPETASYQRASAIRKHVYAYHQGVVDRVLIPSRAFIELDRRVSDAEQARSVGMWSLLLVWIATGAIVTRSFHMRIVVPSVNTMLGKPQAWGTATVTILTGVLVVFAVGASFAIMSLLAPNVQTFFPWLVSLGTVFSA